MLCNAVTKEKLHKYLGYVSIVLIILLKHKLTMAGVFSHLDYLDDPPNQYFISQMITLDSTEAQLWKNLNKTQNFASH